jgi:uncharacterized membrane protein
MISERVTMLLGMTLGPRTKPTPSDPAETVGTQFSGTAGDTILAPRGWVGNVAPVVSGVSARVLASASSLLVWGALLAWSIVLFIEVRSDYLGFRFGRFDFGNMVQAVWSTAHGRPLDTTLGDGEQAVRLASHVDPILVLLAPFWIVWPSPLVLAAGQIAACALGTLPVFWLGRRHLASERVAALLALAYLAYPWLIWTALDAMHPVTLAIPLFLYAIWFLDTDRLWAFAVCAVLIAACGELMGLPLAALGIWYWLARGHRSAGLVVAAAGFAWTLLALKVVVPAFHGADSPFYSYYGTVGGSLEGILRTLFTNPGTIASALFSGTDLGYLILLGVPLAGLFLLSPGLSAVAVPQLLANGLSDSPATSGPQQHYIAAVIPFLVAATVLAIGRLPGRRRPLAAVVVLLLSATMTAFAGPWSGSPSAIWYQEPIPAQHVAALGAAVALVPDEVPVSATNKVGSHLSARRYFYRVPRLGRAEWVVLDTGDPRDGGRAGALTKRIQSSSGWRQVFRRDGVFVFEKRPPA